MVPVTEGVDLAQLSTAPNPCTATGWDSPALLALEAGYDWIVADTGTGFDARSLAAARTADDVLLLVAPELPAVADGYATLKALRMFRPDLRVGCVVNMAESAEEAGGIHEGLLDLSRSFLGAEIDNLGYIPFNRAVRTAAKGQTPFVIAFP